MFSLEVKINDPIPLNEEFPVPLNAYSVGDIKIWKLMTAFFSQLTWDVPVLHPTRSNVILILALPPNLTNLEFISFIKKTQPVKNYSIFILKHFLISALIEFESQGDADKFYIRSLGTPFDRNFPHANCVPLYIYKVCSNKLAIVPIKTLKETEHVEFELPMCPICFKLFDPLISGYFCSCGPEDVSDEAYKEWGSPDCHVCKTLHRAENFANMRCTCGEKSKLWICMQCGHVGCERDRNRHAIEHYNKTQHRFAFRIDKMWLWDYFADRSVDRCFHTPPTSNEGIVDGYKDMLIESITALQAKEDSEARELDLNYGTIIKKMKEDLASLNSEIDSLDVVYQESVRLEEQLLNVMSQMDAVKKTKMMMRVEALENENAKCKKELARLEERQQDLFRKLEIRCDVTDQVILDF